MNSMVVFDYVVVGVLRV